MAINREKLRERLNSYNNRGQKKQSNIWKASKSESTIRIVPYTHNPEDPFIVAYFYYGMNGKTICSPMSIGEPDPIVEQAQKLMKTGNKDDWKYGKSMMPKKRVYVPIIDRDAEDEGVKFWGFGQGIENDLLTYIDNDEYGDITDIETGVDLIIGHKTAAEAGNQYGETSILPKRRSTALTTDKKKLDEWLNNQPKFFNDVYTPMGYDELKEQFEKFLNSEEKADEVEEAIEQTVEEESSEVEDAIAKLRKKVNSKK